ncbi:Rap guanine nucleotide exchange factor 4 [Phlyctochytrium bullatum]|nr:Rap guanine nucleotide exchange factor 4 [Phlyctochytrium bullatum]
MDEAPHTKPNRNPLNDRFSKINFPTSNEARGFIVQPTPSTKHLCGGHKYVWLEVSPKGLRIQDCSSKMECIWHHPLDRIVKFSKNSKNNTFAYTFLPESNADDPNAAVDFRFATSQYLEIFEWLKLEINKIVQASLKSGQCTDSAKPMPTKLGVGELDNIYQAKLTSTPRLSALKTTNNDSKNSRPADRDIPLSHEGGPDVAGKTTAIGKRKGSKVFKRKSAPSLLSHHSDFLSEPKPETDTEMRPQQAGSAAADSKRRSFADVLNTFSRMSFAKEINAGDNPRNTVRKPSAISISSISKKGTFSRSEDSLRKRPVSMMSLGFGPAVAVPPEKVLSESDSHLDKKETSQSSIPETGNSQPNVSKRGWITALRFFTQKHKDTVGSRSLRRGSFSLQLSRHDEVQPTPGSHTTEPEAHNTNPRRRLPGADKSTPQEGLNRRHEPAEARSSSVLNDHSHMRLNQVFTLRKKSTQLDYSPSIKSKASGAGAFLSPLSLMKKISSVAESLPPATFESFMNSRFTKWLEEYPGDFSTPVTKEAASDLINLMEENRPLTRDSSITNVTLRFNRCEFAAYLWQPDNKAFYSNITRYIQRFNQIGYWVATVVVSQSNHRRRVELLEKMIKIAWRCLEYQNFNSAYAIVCGLQTVSVNRLKKTWLSVGSKFLTMYDELQMKFGYSHNFKAYREMELACHPPAIPIFG